MRQIKKGATDRSVTIRIIDATDGSPETGVVYNTSGIDLWYRREGATKTSITEASLAALDTAHTDGGIIHIGDGYYRLDLPDAAWATGANHVMIGGAVTDMIVIGQEVQLVNYDPEDAVRLGLTALPNAAADAAGGLAISDAGGLDLDALGTNAARLTATRASYIDNLVELTAARMGALTDWIDGGRLDLLLDTVLTRLSATRAGYLDLLNTYLDAAISSRLAASGYTAPDNSTIASILLIIANMHDTDLPAVASAVAAIDPPSVGEIADAVLDETLAGHATAGTAGAALADAATAGDPWAIALPAAYPAGSAGAILGSFQTITRVPYTPGLPPVDAFDIAELALRECDDYTALSETTFTAPDGKVEEIIQKFYDLSRRDVLRMAPWTCIAKRAALASVAWTASTEYAEGERIYAGGYVYEATTGGTSGATAPTWPASGTVADGTITWTYLYTYLRSPGENYTEFDFVFVIPNDTIRQIEVYDETTGKPAASFLYEAGVLYTDTEFPIFLYVPDSNDIQYWDAHLHSAMIYALAARIMIPLSGDKDKAITLMQLAAGAASQASGASRREHKQGPQKATGWYGDE